MGTNIVVTNEDQLAIDLCPTTAGTRTIDAIIPMVQRSAGPRAVLRDARLEISVRNDGVVITHFVG